MEFQKKYKYIRNKQFNEWEIAPWDLVLDKNVLLGEGSSGKVYLGEWRRTSVAAKKKCLHSSCNILI